MALLRNARQRRRRYQFLDKAPSPSRRKRQRQSGEKAPSQEARLWQLRVHTTPQAPLGEPAAGSTNEWRPTLAGAAGQATRWMLAGGDVVVCLSVCPCVFPCLSLPLLRLSAQTCICQSVCLLPSPTSPTHTRTRRYTHARTQTPTETCTHPHTHPEAHLRTPHRTRVNAYTQVRAAAGAAVSCAERRPGRAAAGGDARRIDALLLRATVPGSRRRRLPAGKKSLCVCVRLRPCQCVCMWRCVEVLGGVEVVGRVARCCCWPATPTPERSSSLSSTG